MDHQNRPEAYAKKVLQHFGMTNCRPAPTPIKRDKQRVTTNGTQDQFPYRELVGALSYLMIGTRPDTAFAVGMVSRTWQNPTVGDIIGSKESFSTFAAQWNTVLHTEVTINPMSCTQTLILEVIQPQEDQHQGWSACIPVELSPVEHSVRKQ